MGQQSTFTPSLFLFLLLPSFPPLPSPFLMQPLSFYGVEDEAPPATKVTNTSVTSHFLCTLG